MCDRCGLAHRWHVLASDSVAHCTRCDAVLGRGHRVGVQALLALTLAAALVLLIANLADNMTIRLRGGDIATTFPEAVRITWQAGEPLVAIVAAGTALVAPALFIGLRLYVLLGLAVGRFVPGFAGCLRLLHQVSHWNTVEVLTVAALLSLVRIAALAEASAGPAIYAFGVLAMLLAAIDSVGLKHLWWHRP
ncbi:MAG: paraquat-inducible protein A [Burkholderiaceae bacterium]